jgi:hypothetical protein
MDEIEHLRDQAARAERLAKAIVDALTVERLEAFAVECRGRIEALSAERDENRASAVARIRG